VDAAFFDEPLPFDPETSRLLDVARAEFIAHRIRRASVSEVAWRVAPTPFAGVATKTTSSWQ
jgi:hypothetical protein